MCSSRHGASQGTDLEVGDKAVKVTHLSLSFSLSFQAKTLTGGGMEPLINFTLDVSINIHFLGGSAV